MIKLVGDKLKQWDLDRRVEVAPNHNREIMAVRFFKAHVDEPLEVATVEENGVIYAPIPNTLLRDFGVLNVEMKVRDEHGRKFLEETDFYIGKRKKPEDYEYSETPTKAAGGAVSWHDLEDKPFYETEPIETVFVEEQTLTTIEDDGFYAECEMKHPFVDGETYSVVFDGTTYECVAVATPWDTRAIGNMGVLGLEGGEDIPFAFEEYRGMGCLVMDRLGEFTISITGMLSELHQIEEKYIPPVHTKAMLYDGHGGKYYIEELWIKHKNHNSVGSTSILYDPEEEELYLAQAPAFSMPYDTVTLTTSGGLPTVGSTITFDVTDEETIKHLCCGSIGNFIQEVRIVYINDPAYTLWFILDYVGSNGWSYNQDNTPYTGMTVGHDGGIYTLRVYKTSDTSATALLTRVI